MILQDSINIDTTQISTDTKNDRFPEQLSFLSTYNFFLDKVISYKNFGQSYIYSNPLEKKVIIIDKNICNKPENLISYSELTNLQNEYVYLNDAVYRFLEEDIAYIQPVITGQSTNYNGIKKTSDRTNSPDASPLEFYFEENFTDVYGTESLKFLNKEYAITNQDGNTFYLDYLVHTQEGDIAVEENGINYHHPQIIGLEHYRKQLQKQNSCSKWGIKLYRFSTEDCKFQTRIQDNIKRFFGSDSSHFKKTGLLIDRKIKLYEHQTLTLQDIQKTRDNGIKTFLVVLPTASGKSKIIEQDLLLFLSQKPNAKVLILSPNTSIINDWKNRIKASLSQFSSNIDVQTYSYLARNFQSFSPAEFSYIVADEAHHTVAPTYKRIIQYFTPEFLIGLTATDQRPDKKKLETIFGSYRTNLSLVEAMNKKIIAQANVFRIETNIDLSRVRFNGKDYVNADLEKTIRVTSRNDLIVSVIKKYFSDSPLHTEQGLIFCVNTEHAKEMAKLMNQAGITAASYTSKDHNHEKFLKDFTDKKIRFLCSCQMISEGWDYPSLKIIVMARPTVSKVLYLQQIGRGLRKTSTKENVFIIDVVDEYGAMLHPCTMHSIFHNPYYVPFGVITKLNYHTGDMVTVDGLKERITAIKEVNIENFSEKYADYISVEQFARDCFVSTDTVNDWIKKHRIIPDVSFPFGTKKIFMFSSETAKQIKINLNLSEHNETTIYKDFFDFLENRDYSLSYKMPFLLSLFKNCNDIGESSLDEVLNDYTSFYLSRLNENLPVDKKNCPYTKIYLQNKTLLKENMLSNPFEKFERKRFIYLSKDLGIISINPSLWQKLTNTDIEQIKNQLYNDILNYYKNLGGLQKSDGLLNFAKQKIYTIKPTKLLKVADSVLEK